MNIETVTRPQMTVVGILVEDHWTELPLVVPAAWREVFDRQGELNPACGPLGDHLEVSVSREDGHHRELVGVIASRDARPPEGMVKLDIPANTYLSAVHEGPLASIAEGFAALYDHAAIQGLEATDFKLDIGYSPGLPPGRHELFVALQPLRPPRFS